MKDIRSGSSSFPRHLTNVGGTLYFSARDTTSGVELWKSDGTESGTSRVKDIRTGSGHSYPASLTNVDGSLYFIANDGTSGVELWKSDGTEAGTQLAKDFAEGAGSGSPQLLTTVGSQLFVVAKEAHYGEEIWIANLAATGLAGDYDQNDVVDGADFLLWQRQFGGVETPVGSGADGDGSGAVDAGDLTIWRDHFGETTLSVAAATTASSTVAAIASLVAAEEDDDFSPGDEDNDAPVDIDSRDALYAGGDFTTLFAEVRGEGWRKRGWRGGVSQGGR